MKKNILSLLIILFISFHGASQCQVTNNEVISATNTLKTLMECNLKKQKFDKALAIYLTYVHINENYSVPESVKQYFANISDPHLQRLARVRLSLRQQLTQSSDQSHTSAMPTIIVVTQ